MVEKKNAKRSSITEKNSKKVSVFEIDYDKLAEAIVKAKEETKDISANKTQSNKKEIKDVFKLFWKLITLKKNEINDDSMTFAFLKLATEGIVLIAELILYLFGVSCLLSPFLIGTDQTSFSLGGIIILVIYGLLMIIYARFLRVSRLEIDRLNDREYLNTIIGSFLGIIGTIIAIIELIRSVG